MKKYCHNLGQCEEDVCRCDNLLDGSDLGWEDNQTNPLAVIAIVLILSAIVLLFALSIPGESWTINNEPQEEQATEAQVTAYSCEGITTEAQRRMNCPNGVTKMGTIPTPGITAACPPHMLGEWINIEGHYYQCQDTGGRIVGNKIDLYMESIAMAKEFGKKILKIK